MNLTLLFLSKGLFLHRLFVSRFMLYGIHATKYSPSGESVGANDNSSLKKCSTGNSSANALNEITMAKEGGIFHCIILKKAI